MMLEINDLSAGYGHIEALKHVNYVANVGEIVSIIGSNGAGKSTLLKCISGQVKPKGGEIKFCGQKTPFRPHEVVKLGIIHVPEGRRTFSGLTVRDNLLVGGYLIKGKALEENLERMLRLFPILKQRESQFAGTLSGGEQQMLAIARGLMANPKLIMLDEPSLGLAPIIVDQVFEIIKEIRDMGVTVLLVEQNARKALSICNHACVIENGMINICGTGADLLSSDVVKKAYLGS